MAAIVSLTERDRAAHEAAYRDVADLGVAIFDPWEHP